MECEPNFDLQNNVTPVKADVFRQLLVQANYDPGEIEFLYKGFKEGFPIGYMGPKDRVQYARNLPLRFGSKTQLWNKMIKEVQLKRFAGPFERAPYDRFIQSPAGLVPKQSSNVNNQTCLIFHLSWPEKNSVNFHTLKGLCSVKYKDIDHAIHLSMETGKGWYMAKSDMKSAFRHLAIRPEDWCWLVLMAYHPVTNKKFYFLDNCTPFGSSISCSHFQ